MSSEERRRLDSWKAIAQYLDRDVRTVMRWEKRAGMPVHRVPGSRRGRSVFAYADEIDRWLHGEQGAPREGGETDRAEPVSEPIGSRQPQPESTSSAPEAVAAAPRPIWASPAVFAAGGLAVLLIGWMSVSDRLSGVPSSVGPIAKVESEAGVIVARDIDDEVVWTHPHARAFDFEDDGISRALDLEGDGNNELFFATNAIDLERPGFMEGEVYRFSASGSLRWRLTLNDAFEFGSARFSRPWLSLFLDVVRVDGAPYIIWSTHHLTWWPSILVLVDPGGEVRGKFVNSGWVYVANMLRSPDADLLLAGGVSNSRSGAVMAVLDASDISGSSPEDPGSPFECLSCPAGKPLRYFVFPRSEVNRAAGLPYNGVAQILVDGDQVRVVVREGSALPTPVWVYEFSPDFELLRSVAGDSYWAYHETLRREGKIDHAEGECPERQPRAIRSWTPETGWGTVPPH